MRKILAVLIFLTIALAPLYVVRGQVLSVPTTLLELLILATVVVWFLDKLRRSDFSWPKTGLELPIALFLLAGVISLLVTPDLRHGLGVFKAYILEPIFFFFVLTDFALKQEGLPRGIFNFSARGGPTLGGQFSIFSLVTTALVLASFWLSVLGIAQAVFGFFVVTSHQAGRAHAVFNNGNALALFLGPVIVLLTGWLRENWQRLDTVVCRCIVAGGLGILLFAFLLTRSTGGLMTLLVAVFVWILTRVKQISSRQVWLVLGLVYLAGQLLFFAFLPQFMPTKLKSITNPWARTNLSTHEIRLCLWEGAVNLIREYPLTGAGLSGFKEVYVQKYHTCDAEPLEYPHNLLLNFWAELGLLGLLSFLGVLYILFFKLPITNYQLPITYLLIHGLVDVPYFKNDLALLFWVLAALVVIKGWEMALLPQKRQ